MIVLLVIISLSVLILAHELGHFLMAKFFKVRVDEFGLGFPPKIAGKKFGETTYSLNALPFGGFVRIHGEDGGDHEVNERSFSIQSTFRKSAIVLAGVFMNIVFGFVIFSLIFMVGAPEHLVVADVFPDTPAEAAGIVSGDVISGVLLDGQALKDPIRSEAFINLVKEANGKEIIFDVKRGEEIKSIKIIGRENPPEGQGSLGVSLIEVGFSREPFFKSLGKGVVATGESLALIARSFFELFSKALYDASVFKTVSGPVGIIAIAANTSSLGLVYLMQLMALISLNLAVLNLIPFPALDGGRFLFLILERIKGSPISRKLQLAVNGIGFVLLILLMIVVTVQDISRL